MHVTTASEKGIENERVFRRHHAADAAVVLNRFWRSPVFRFFRLPRRVRAHARFRRWFERSTPAAPRESRENDDGQNAGASGKPDPVQYRHSIQLTIGDDRAAANSRHAGRGSSRATGMRQFDACRYVRDEAASFARRAAQRFAWKRTFAGAVPP